MYKLDTMMVLFNLNTINTLVVLFNVYTLGYPDGFIQCTFFSETGSENEFPLAAPPADKKLLKK